MIDDIVYHPYGVPATEQECEELGRSCQGGSHVVLLNHGLLTYGPTIPGALMRLYTLERAAEVELIARTLDEPPVMVAPEVIAKFAEFMARARAKPDYGVLEFEGLVRTIDRKDPNYRI